MTALHFEPMTEKDSTRDRDRDLRRLVVKTDPRLSMRLNAVMSGRKYRHPHGHLFAGSPLMKILKDR
jgi:hypothetical protein